MHTPKLHFSPKLPAAAQVLIYPVVLEKQKQPIFCGIPALDKMLEKRIKKEEFSGDEEETLVVYPDLPRIPGKVVFVGVGEKKKLNVAGVLNSFAMGARAAGANTVATIVTKDLGHFTHEIVEAISLGNYRAGRFKTGKAKKESEKKTIKDLHIVFQGGIGRPRTHEALAKKALKISEAVCSVRDWVNGGPKEITGAFLEERARELAKKYGYKIEVLNKKQLEKMGAGMILAVNSGSDEDARMIKLEYTPEGKSGAVAAAKDEKPIIIVGKGILFDSGGYNLKPTGHIETMQEDMAGAAVIIGIFQLLAELKIPHRVIGIAPITTNLIGAKSYKPSDIITSLAGKTIEITNTDAEGRLVLGDALHYAQQFKPRFMIDLATLTGACMVALGSKYAGLLGNDEELQEKIFQAGKEVDELLCKFPIHKVHTKGLKSDMADLRNTNLNKYGGVSNAAAFLKEFVGETKWAHIDIAGTAFVEDPKPYEAKMATGYGIRLLMRFLEKLEA